MDPEIRMALEALLVLCGARDTQAYEMSRYDYSQYFDGQHSAYDNCIDDLREILDAADTKPIRIDPVTGEVQVEVSDV